MAHINQQKREKAIPSWMDGWMDGWMHVKAILRIAYSNQKKSLKEWLMAINKSMKKVKS